MNLLKKGDIVLVAVLLVLAVGAIVFLGVYRNLNEDSGKVAEIRYDNQIIKKIDLEKVDGTERIEISKEYHQVVLVEKGRIRFEESDCPDKICVKTGWIEHKGETAVCLPNKTILIIEGEPEEVDGVTY